MNPVGPHSPAIYWRRRAVLLLVVLLLAYAAVYSCSGGVGGGGSASGHDTTVSSAGRTTPPAVDSTPFPLTAPLPGATAAPTPAGATPGASAGAAAVRACADSDIAVTATTDATSYGATGQPMLTLAVTNTSATPCRRDVGRAALELRVTSGAAEIWSSNYCGPKGGANVQTLARRVPFTQHLPWRRTRVSASCATLGPATAGTYRVLALAGTAQSAPSIFTLV